MIVSPKTTVLLLLCLLPAACASEDWDNPRDPDGTAFSSCPRIESDDADDAEDCLLYDDFADSLDRWNVSRRSDGRDAMLRTVEVAGVSHRVVVLPACRDGDTAALTMEIDVPAGYRFVDVDARWRIPDDQEGPHGRLGISLDGATLNALPRQEGEWNHTRDGVESTTSGPSILRLYNRPHADGNCTEIEIDSILVSGDA